MSGFIENFVFKHVAPQGIRHIVPVREDVAAGLVADIYRQMRRDFQLAPPLTVHSLIPELLAGVWAASRETLISGPADRIAREAIAAAVSRINACPYCVDVHSMMLDGAGRHDLATALSTPQGAAPPDSGMAKLVEWAMATRSPDAAILGAPPFPPQDAPQLIGTAVMFHYINRVVNVFLEESPIPSYAPRLVKNLVGSAMTSRIVGVVAEPGESLCFLAESPLPSDLIWAAPNQAVAGGLARMAAAVERAGRATLPAAVRELLLSHLRQWRGADLGLSRRWVEDVIAELGPSDQPAARLAMLAAFASHQVDESVIQACREVGASNINLIGIVAWASFQAARKVGSWLGLPGRSQDSTPAFPMDAQAS